MVTSFVYPTFQEVPALTTKQFLAQLGGNLSLWLGSSFLVLVHMLVFLVRMTITYPKKKDGQKDRLSLESSMASS